jgi:ADP-heptose:LPS heptosyltransferase
VQSQRTVHVARNGGLGDVLMCTPALRELKRVDPSSEIHFYTELIELMDGLPYLDKVSLTMNSPHNAVWMKYEDAIPSEKHLAVLIGESIGMNVIDVRPDCIVVSDLVASFHELWADLPRPHIVVQRNASDWTPNKDWNENHWIELISNLLGYCTVIEIGHASVIANIGQTPNYFDLRGKTSLSELVACVAAGDLVIAPDSGPIHIAAAVGTPTVIVMGGFLLPTNTLYPRNKVLHTALECSPCWLRAPCPIDRECLRAISPEVVENAASELWLKAGMLRKVLKYSR